MVAEARVGVEVAAVVGGGEVVAGPTATVAVVAAVVVEEAAVEAAAEKRKEAEEVEGSAVAVEAPASGEGGFRSESESSSEAWLETEGKVE